MKLISAFIIAIGVSFFAAGCLDDSGDPNRLTFENLSTRTVTVIPLSTEWGAFTLEPGEKRRLDNIKNIDHRLSPDERVQAGRASSERHIIIVNRPP